MQAVIDWLQIPACCKEPGIYHGATENVALPRTPHHYATCSRPRRRPAYMAFQAACAEGRPLKAAALRGGRGEGG